MKPVKVPEPIYPFKLRRLYWPFLAFAEVCRELVGSVAGSFEAEGKCYTIPRFVFHGPDAGIPPVRLGLFALLEGDALGGALGLQHLLGRLIADPAPARGLELTLYPLCNPTGYEDGTRCNRAGCDLNREFWRGSSQPEVRILEAQLRAERFDGIVTLQAGDAREDLDGFAPAGQQPRPFEIVLMTSASLPMTQQIEAIGCALLSVLADCRGFIAQESQS